MGRFTRQATIRTTPAQVFATLADVADAKSWMPEIEALEMVSEGPIGVGSMWIETRRTKRGPQVSRLEVTAFEEPSTMTLHVIAGTALFGVRITCAFTVAPVDGGAEVTYAGHARGRGFAWLFSRAITKEVEAEAGPFLERLKAHVEGSHGPAGKPEALIEPEAVAGRKSKAVANAKRGKGAKGPKSVKKSASR